MAYLKNYENDIFISYCHRDNLKQFDEQFGWVENFYKNLRTCLLKSIGSKELTIWWDEKGIDGNTRFNESIAEALKNSAILICLNSPSYLNSEYCKKELDQFYQHFKNKTPGINIGEQSRIFNVLLYNISHEEWPPEFVGTPGFPFHDSVDENEKGHPLNINSGQFKEAFLSFCDSIDNLIKGIEGGPPPPLPIFDIFFGEVADDLRDLRKTTIDEVKKEKITIKDKKTNSELKKQKFEIIAGIPPPFEKEEHEKLVYEDLEKVELSVHLLDDVAGRNITEEEPVCYPQRQAELSLLTSKPKLIWLPAEMDIETVKEKNYKNFLVDLENGNLPATGYKYVRSLESEVAQHVMDMANNVYEEWLANHGTAQVFLDTHYNDQVFALDVYKKLLDNHIQPIFNPQEGDPKKNESILEDRIRQVSTVIFVYGKITRDWITERIKTALKLVVEKKYPINEFIVLMLPPHKDPNLVNLGQSPVKISPVKNSNALQLDLDVLEQILKSIKAVA